MTTDGRGFWPTAEQQLVLRAALLDGAAAKAAWHEWRQRVDFDEMDAGSGRLLPQLARNLTLLGIADPVLEKLRGVRRKTWMRNTQRLIETAALLGAFQEAGIPTLLLKGAALVSLYYPDRGLRPMTDSDVLVPFDHARSAMALLMARGWSPIGWAPEAQRPELTLSVQHAHAFRQPSGQELDLHWHVFWECCTSGADVDLWAAAIPVDIRGVPTLALCATDQLLHVCVHGARWSAASPLRWAADALMILRAPGVGIDWERLVDQARRRGLVLPMHDTLTLLVQVLNAPVPPNVLATLRQSPVPWIQRVEYAASTRAPRLWDSLVVHLCHHLRVSGGRRIPRAILGFVEYLRLTYEQESFGRLAAVIRRKIRARVSGRRCRLTARLLAPRAPGRGTAQAWLDRPPWVPVHAPTRSSPSARSRHRLLAVISQFKVETASRYQSTPTNRGTSTRCNIFIWDVTRAMGVEIPHWVGEGGRAERVGQGKELTANATVRWLETHGPAHGWCEKRQYEAVLAAEAGLPVLAVWHNPSGHGHAAVVVPGSNGNLNIAQAGASCFSSRPLAEGFGDRPVRFFVHS